VEVNIQYASGLFVEYRDRRIAVYMNVQKHSKNADLREGSLGPNPESVLHSHHGQIVAALAEL